MAEVKEVTVPDIGDFDDVPVIEVLVSPGDTVAAEDPLVTLESDKATMDVPSPFAGVVQDLKVSVGDKVAEGTLLMSLEIGEGGSGNGSAPKDEPGRSDWRRSLREFFEVDRRYVALAALRSVAPDKAAEAVAKYEIDADAEAPWRR